MPLRGEKKHSPIAILAIPKNGKHEEARKQVLIINTIWAISTGLAVPFLLAIEPAETAKYNLWTAFQTLFWNTIFRFFIKKITKLWLKMWNISLQNGGYWKRSRKYNVIRGNNEDFSENARKITILRENISHF